VLADAIRNKFNIFLNNKNFGVISNQSGERQPRKPSSTLNEISKDDYQQYIKSAAIALKEYLEEQAILKNAAVGSLGNTDDYIVQKDPYTSKAKIQFEEGLRADGILSRSFERKADFVFGKGIRTVLDTENDNFVDFKARQAAVESIMSNKEYMKAKDIIDTLNKKVNFRFRTRGAYILCKAFGRSALLKDLIDKDENSPTNGLPTSLYPLNSRSLGNIYINRKTKYIEFIEYQTENSGTKENKVFYKPEELIYFANRDYNISPNTLGFGYSDIEPIKDISETNRIYDEEDLKEIAKALWSAYLILRFPDGSNSSEVQNFLNNFDPAKPLATTMEVVPQIIQVAHEMQNIIEGRNQNDRRILRAAGIPSYILGFEDITNRSVAQFVTNAYKETLIEQEQIFVKDIIERDWLLPLWSKLTNIEEEEMLKLKPKITLEFEEYIFDTFEQRVAAYLPLYQEGIITNVELLKRIGEDELAAKTKEMKKVMMGPSSPFGGFGKPGSKLRVDQNKEFDNLGGTSGDSGLDSEGSGGSAL
jgi:hypothetical protein